MQKRALREAQVTALCAGARRRGWALSCCLPSSGVGAHAELSAAARVRWAGVLGAGDCDCARWASERCRADPERVRMSYDDRAGAVMRFWTLAANLGAFRVEDNVREQDEELWRTSRKVGRGDRVGIYKYKGRG
jgi:hypothetical protein